MSDDKKLEFNNMMKGLIKEVKISFGDNLVVDDVYDPSTDSMVDRKYKQMVDTDYKILCRMLNIQNNQNKPSKPSNKMKNKNKNKNKK